MQVSLNRIEALLQRLVEQTAPKPKAVRGPVEARVPELQVIWNKWADEKLPKCLFLAPQSARHRNAELRWKQRPDEAFWIGIVRKINDSAFCKGENDHKWIASFEFFVRPDTVDNVLSGKYADRKKEDGAPAKKLVIAKSESGATVSYYE